MRCDRDDAAACLRDVDIPRARHAHRVLDVTRPCPRGVRVGIDEGGCHELEVIRGRAELGGSARARAYPSDASVVADGERPIVDGRAVCRHQPRRGDHAPRRRRCLRVMARATSSGTRTVAASASLFGFGG